MRKVTIRNARLHLLRLLRYVEDGERIVITRRGLRGKIEVPDDFNAPLPKEILDAFEGKD